MLQEYLKELFFFSVVIFVPFFQAVISNLTMSKTLLKQRADLHNEAPYEQSKRRKQAFVSKEQRIQQNS